MIPLIAIFAGTASEKVGEEIGVGAILGAPLMLSTLTLSLMGLGVAGRAAGPMLKPEVLGLRRDLHFFLIAFVLATLAMYVPENLRILRDLISIALAGLYLIYIFATLRASVSRQRCRASWPR
jgi:cation:H+ antiporter